MTEKEAKSSNFWEPSGLHRFIKIMPHPHQNVPSTEAPITPRLHPKKLLKNPSADLTMEYR